MEGCAPGHAGLHESRAARRAKPPGRRPHDQWARVSCFTRCSPATALSAPGRVSDVLRGTGDGAGRSRSEYDKGIPKDLETICLKCLQKEPAKSLWLLPGSCRGPGRWLRDEPIAARPIGLMERCWRWCRRNPAVAAASRLPPAFCGTGSHCHHGRLFSRGGAAPQYPGGIGYR